MLPLLHQFLNVFDRLDFIYKMTLQTPRNIKDGHPKSTIRLILLSDSNSQWQGNSRISRRKSSSKSSHRPRKIQATSSIIRRPTEILKSFIKYKARSSTKLNNFLPSPWWQDSESEWNIERVAGTIIPINLPRPVSTPVHVPTSSSARFIFLRNNKTWDGRRKRPSGAGLCWCNGDFLIWMLMIQRQKASLARCWKDVNTNEDEMENSIFNALIRSG